MVRFDCVSRTWFAMRKRRQQNYLTDIDPFIDVILPVELPFGFFFGESLLTTSMKMQMLMVLVGVAL